MRSRGCERNAHGKIGGKACGACILDEGVTLAAITQRLREQGASDVLSAVFADKNLGRSKPIAADFVGVHLPNRYVFGFGMDVKGAWRNLPAVYAVKGL